MIKCNNDGEWRKTWKSVGDKIKPKHAIVNTQVKIINLNKPKY